jgi:predicted TPR repeat methyltransferase
MAAAARPTQDEIAPVVAALGAHQGSEAETLLAALRDRFPQDGDVLNLSGIAAHQLGRPEEAIRLTAAAVALDPDSGLFHANHGAALAAAGRPDDAAAAFQRSLALRPDHAPTRRNLGLALAQMGRGAQALPMLYRARDLAPDDPETHVALARCLREAGSRAAAAECAQAALALDPPPFLAEEARFLMADAGAAMPPQAPADYVRLLFDAYAPTFDKHLREELEYRTPELLADALAEAGAPRDAAARVLDLGCGTGLSGLALKPFARAITGVDLSPRMLALAEATGAYARLVEAGLPEWLTGEPPASCDIAFAADVMIYLGAPAPVFAELARVLRPGGFGAFSFERAGDGRPIEVSDQLRYRHAPDAVLHAAQAAGFTPLVQRDCALRLERNRPVEGFLLVLRRA